MSAVRNLAGRELNGRPLRIDSAANAPSGGNTGPFGGGEGARGMGAGPAQAPKPMEVGKGWMFCPFVILQSGRKSFTVKLLSRER